MAGERKAPFEFTTEEMQAAARACVLPLTELALLLAQQDFRGPFRLYIGHGWTVTLGTAQDPAPPGPDRYAEGWRAGVLAAREYLRQAWDDGDQGNGDDAAELELLRTYADRAVPEPAPAATGARVRRDPEGACRVWLLMHGSHHPWCPLAPHAGEKEDGDA